VFLGKDLAKRARKGSATDRAILAVETTGAILDRVTREQAITLTGANKNYEARYRRMTEPERAAVRAGRLKLVTHRDPRPRPLTDLDLDRVFAQVGDIDRWYATAERARRSALGVAAAE
jgi:hypothetical protein